MSASEPANILLPREVQVGRRNFLRSAGALGIGVAASLSTGKAFAESTQERAQELEQSKDTVKEIFTAALIAEDLASTFYYNGLVGPVIQDPRLAGPGGTATNVTAAGDFGNVAYIRAALTEEISHANLFRSLLGISDASKDPVQTFYFPAGSFDTLGPFLALLDALENAFIGAYMNAIQEFATMSSRLRILGFLEGEQKYTPEQLDYFAKVSASIMGVECEHRVLGRDLGELTPANNRLYEQTDGLNAVFNGPNSAVAALTPFLTPSTGPAYSLGFALANQSAVSEPVSGAPPAF
jgi:hypothetical protein